MGIGGDHNLAEIRWIGENLLIAGHAGVEANFAESGAGNPDGFSVKDRPVGEQQEGGWTCVVFHGSCV